MKVLIVVARRYNGHELWTTLGILQEQGIEFDIRSTHTLLEDEVTGQPNRIELTLDDPVQIEDYQGIMIISGNMADTESYWTDERVLSLVRGAHYNDLPIAAICCSVPTIREAAEGKKVSFYPLIRSERLLVEAGAIPQTVSITVDGKLVTAEHQMATQRWASVFTEVLRGEEVDLNLQDSGYIPRGRERKLPARLEIARGTDPSYRWRKK